MLSRDFGALEVLVRRAVVALGQRRALARLALPRRRAAARDAAVERARFDLLLDERDRGSHALLHRPGDLRLRRDREVPPDVLEERPVGARGWEGPGGCRGRAPGGFARSGGGRGRAAPSSARIARAPPADIRGAAPWPHTDRSGL